MRWRFFLSTLLAILLPVAAAACPALPYALQNGTTADATQVMADFNSLVGCANLLAPLNNPSFTGALGVGVSSISGKPSIQLGNGAFFSLVNGDLWITTNAYYDGSNWQRQNTSDASFAIDFATYNNIPGESATTGVVWWTAAPGTNPINPAFGAANGWALNFAQTEFKDLVAGGFGVEIDGNGTLPYGSAINNNYSGEGQRVGMVWNLFSDLAGVDVPTDPSWYFGILGDSFVIQRAPAGQTTAAGLGSDFIVDSSGLTHVTGLVAGGVSGVSCSGAPTASFAVVGGVVTHC